MISGKLENVGSVDCYNDPQCAPNIDSKITDIDGCYLHDIWGGDRFGDATAYLDHVTYPLEWLLGI